MSSQESLDLNKDYATKASILAQARILETLPEGERFGWIENNSAIFRKMVEKLEKENKFTGKNDDEIVKILIEEWNNISKEDIDLPFAA